MIDEDTVFILGAGASCPYGFPTGELLRTYICNEFYRNIHRVLDRSGLPGKRSVYKASAVKLSKTFKTSSTPLIDLFLKVNVSKFDI